MNLFNEIFGVGKDLTAGQMGARAFIFFFITLIYIKVGGVRSFGKRSSLDMIMVIVLGSVMARGIVGATGIGATAASSAVLVITQRITAWATLRSAWLETLLKGRRILLYDKGNFLVDNMNKTGISMADFTESLRIATQQEDMDCVERAYMEANGEVSFILKKTDRFLN